MPIFRCPYCGEHFKQPLPVCPDCGRQLPERTQFTDAPPAEEWEPSPATAPAPVPVPISLPRVDEGDFDNNLWNPHPLRSFVRGFLAVGGLMALAGVADDWLDRPYGASAFRLSPLLGIAGGAFLAMFAQVLKGGYEAVAGSDPAGLRVAKRVRAFLRREAAAPDEAIRPADQPPASPERLSAPADAPDGPAAPPEPEAPSIDRAFYAVLGLALLFTFGHGFASVGNFATGVAYMLFFGLPSGCFLGALAVRVARSPGPTGGNRPEKRKGRTSPSP